ncbi:HEXXH motif-containing putative peptide modification protein [Streptomyces tendae]|uniref:aKG-HExxH-type peptide beta-hydroxylase n=1 Tax=Streptomyces tendae TaxID=1932 RepID=UPI0036779BB2
MIGPYVLPDDVFDALAAGAGGRPAVLLLLRARRSRNLLLLRRALDGPCGRAVEPAADLLAGVERVDPEAARSVIDGPAFGTWAARTLGDCPAHHRGGCAGRDLAALAVLAAVRAARPARVTVPVREGRLRLPGLGTVTGLGETPEALVVVEAPAGAEGVPGTSAGSCRVRVLTAAGEHVLPRDPSRPGHGWQPVAVLDARHRGLTLRLPLENAAPELPALETASAGPAAWQDLLRQAWELLVDNHPRRAEELAAGLNGIVPLPAPARGVASATSRHAFGTVLTSWPADPERLALTLLHEFQHSKLSALTDLVTLYEPGGRPRLYAPWRPDPRPPGGLLQGIYAHLGDLAFWQERSGSRHGPAQADAAWRLAQTRAHVERGLTEAASHVRLTALGTRFLERLARTVRDGNRGGTGSGGERLARAVARVQAGDEAVWRLRWAAADDAGTERLAALWRAGRPAGPLPAEDVRAATGAVAGPGPEFGRWAARQRGAERARPAREAADAVLAEPDRAQGWAELAAAAAEEDQPGADVLRARTELVRDLCVRLTARQAAMPPGTASPGPPDSLAPAAWPADLAVGPDPSGGGPAVDAARPPGTAPPDPLALAAWLAGMAVGPGPSGGGPAVDAARPPGTASPGPPDSLAPAAWPADLAVGPDPSGGGPAVDAARPPGTTSSGPPDSLAPVAWPADLAVGPDPSGGGPAVDAARPPGTASSGPPDSLAPAAWPAGTAVGTDRPGAGPAAGEEEAVERAPQARGAHPARGPGRVGRGEPPEAGPAPGPPSGDGLAVPTESGSAQAPLEPARSPGPDPAADEGPVAPAPPDPGEGPTAGAEPGGGGVPGQKTGVSMSQNARSPLAKTSATG